MPPKKKVKQIAKKKRSPRKVIKKQTGGNKSEVKRPWMEDGFNDFEIEEDGEIYLTSKPWKNGVRPVEEKKAPPPVHRAPVAPHVEKKWYQKIPFGFIKKNQLASRLARKVHKPLGDWLQAQGWGDKKKTRKKKMK